MTEMRDALTPAELERLMNRKENAHGRWSHTDLLLALIADRVSHQTWVLGQWKKRPPAPEPIPRPGIQARKRAPETVEEARERVDDLTWRTAEALRLGLPLPTE